MRYSAITFVIALALVSIVRADPATQPTCDVYLTPFSALGSDTSLDWAGKAVAQNLLSDLARSKFHPLAADQAIPTTTDAIAAAKSAGAKYLITGTYQTVELQVRFTGQIIDLVTGNVLGGLSATGAPRDLFALEDSLSAQAIAQLAGQSTVARNKPPAVIPAALAPVALLQVIQPPAVAAPGTASAYQGSALQGYVDANRTPSTDFAQQVQDALDRDMYSSYNFGYSGYPYLSTFGGYGYSGYGFGGYGYGLGSSITSGAGPEFGSGFGGSHHAHGHDAGQR